MPSPRMTTPRLSTRLQRDPPAASCFPCPSSQHVVAKGVLGDFPKNKGKALDLFSGTGSVSKRLEYLGYEVISLDLDPKTDPTILSDLLEWKYTDYPSGFFKIIAASVPCAEYSIAKTTAPREFFQGRRIGLPGVRYCRIFFSKNLVD